MNNICCIGEMLIDFICTDIDTDLSNGENFKKHAGGAPANVAAAIATLGGNALFIGTVGNDPFGRFLKDTIESTGVDSSMMLMKNGTSTTLAFVSLQANGERDFVFNRGADAELCFGDIDQKKIKDARIVHFGSATALLPGKLRQTYLELLDLCVSENIFVAFDPNFREDLWKNNEKEFINLSLDCIKKADFIKLSEDELYLLTGIKDPEKAVSGLERRKSSVLAVTLGSRGTLVSADGDSRIIGSIKIKSVDSTGAGDAFTGAFLLKTSELEKPFELYCDRNKLDNITGFANKVGAIVCTEYGAITALSAVPGKISNFG